MTYTLERTAFSTSRLMEFFTEKELSMQIGHDKESWPVALLKELIDNALDACESAGIPPQIEIAVEVDSISVRDNGPGLPVAILEKSLDYMIRVSDKNHYISPTRGQLGNALKCVYAAPFVTNGEQGRVEVITGGQTHRIDVTLDRLSQAPKLAHTIHPDGLVKNGTLVKMEWPQIASYLEGAKNAVFYKPVPTAFDLVRGYSLFNPHATFVYKVHGETLSTSATDTAWRKWKPNDPTSPHWYDAGQLRALIAAYVNNEREGEEAKTVRAFVSEFAGLSGTAKQKSVTEAVGLTGAYLHDLVKGDDVELEPVSRLLAAMRTESRPIKPSALGKVGKEHITHWMTLHSCDPESIRYKCISGNDNLDMPFVLEVALAYYIDPQAHRDTFIGLNFTPALGVPFESLSSLLAQYRIDKHDPVIVALHLACPRLDFTDRGKSRLNL